MKRALFIFLFFTSISTLLAQEINSIISVHDGQKYKIVKIGNQWWMAENLIATKYNDGTHIPLVTDVTAWSKLITPGYCWYANDSIAYSNPYGALYNWYAVNTGKLCPTGWHVPTDAEWTVLSDYLGGTNIAGSKLKEIGTTHWLSPNSKATNEIGFTSLPGGNRNFDGTYYNLGYYGYWWTSTEYSSTNAYNRYMFYNNSSIIGFSHLKKYGFSVRCVKD